MNLVRVSPIIFGAVTALSVYSNNKNTILLSLNGLYRSARTVYTVGHVNADYLITTWKMEKYENQHVADKMLEDCHLRSALKIRDACTKNGGIYIKLGQAMATFNHILPVEYTETLHVLYNGVKPRPYREVENIFKREFGKPPTEVFAKFDREAFAAASLSQVHKAETKDGQHVAVKVQYEDLQRNFKSDIKILQFLVDVVAYLNPRFSLKWLIENAFKAAEMEMDFKNEAANSERCAQDLRHLKFVKIPRVFNDLSTRTVLTMEFEDGIPITNAEDIARAGLNLKELSEKVVRIFAEQIFVTGFVHADPHPGNILVQNKSGRPIVVLLDHGLYQEFDEKDRLCLCGLYKAIMAKNFTDLRKYSLLLGVEDYMILGQIVTQTMILDSNRFGLPRKLTEKELKRMREAILKNVDKIISVMREMPPNLLLVIRNIHFVRALVRKHGNLADRHGILTISAIDGYERQRSTWLPCSMRRVVKQSYFLFRLRFQRFLDFWAKLVMVVTLYFSSVNKEQLMEIESVVGSKLEKSFSTLN